MSATATRSIPAGAPVQRRWKPSVPPLENGDHLTATEFLRRYRAMPNLKKAELIQGIVHMASPVRSDRHGEPDFLLHGLLANYVMRTPGIIGSTNATVRLGADDVPQPDILLRFLPECGGQAVLDADGYVRGAPELVVEIAASSASIDTRGKLQEYRRAGVREYIVWRTEEESIDWWQLVEDDYLPLLLGDDRIFRSALFPGLWLNVDALIREDGAALLNMLQSGMASEQYQRFSADLRQRFKV